MLIEFVIQFVLDVYLLRVVWAQHRRLLYLRETATLQIRASELMAEILSDFNTRIPVKETAL